MSDDQALTGPGTQTRRTLLTGVGAIGAAVVLAACGSDDDNDAGSGAPTSGGPAVPSTGDAGGGDRQDAQSVATTTDIPVGGGKILPAGVVITQPTAGQFKGFSAICTHQNCPVTNVDGGTINCTCHGSKFSIEDGSVKAGPATKPLPPKNIKVTGDQISLA
ncbi:MULTISPECIES: Rieske (2Fe-2S) protein [unclassified Micromonospora]|uniref:Rieske (2Fe-2S) protein n=1 Tax=unclassified Micromonospora TaxID=2617518 RepID=UPI002E1CF45D